MPVISQAPVVSLYSEPGSVVTFGGTGTPGSTIVLELSAEASITATPVVVSGSTKMFYHKTLSGIFIPGGSDAGIDVWPVETMVASGSAGGFTESVYGTKVGDHAYYVKKNAWENVYDITVSGFSAYMSPTVHMIFNASRAVTVDANGRYTASLDTRGFEPETMTVKQDGVQVATLYLGTPPAEPLSFYCVSKPGWNLVSYPVVNDTLMASGLGGTGLIAIAKYDRAGSGFNIFLPGISPPSADFPVRADTGYFISSASSTFIKATGSFPSSRWADIYQGYNLIGWSSYDASSASASCAALSGGQIAARYKNADNSFSIYIEGISPPSADFNMLAGEGYYMYSGSATPEKLYFN